MSYGKRAILLTLGIGVFLFFYLRSVNNEREEGIRKLINQPEIGDVYKIRYRDNEGNRTVRYFRLARTGESVISFYRGKMGGWNLSDILLDDYDTEWLINFSELDLQALVKGKYDKNGMRNATLVEIERKKDRVPANSM
jgi:hypothetical protein